MGIVNHTCVRGSSGWAGGELLGEGYRGKSKISTLAKSPWCPGLP